jgi:hypothetical protein
LALQECPGDVVWATRTFGSAGYQALGATQAHADHVILLVRNGISAKLVPLSTDNHRYLLPAVMAELQWEQRRLLVASVHLAPFREGSFKRRTQVQRLLQQASSLPLIFAGDTNMRDSEDGTMEEGPPPLSSGADDEPPLGLMDVWKLAGSDPKTKFTWDTKDHTTEPGGGGGSFNRYYGSRTREYNARYDRIYCSIPQSGNLEHLEAQSFELIANQPVTSKFHFLSDHFGMLAVLKIQWKTA